MCWILDLEDKIHSLWVLNKRPLRAMFFSKPVGKGSSLRLGSKKFKLFQGGCPAPPKGSKGRFNVPPPLVLHATG